MKFRAKPNSGADGSTGDIDESKNDMELNDTKVINIIF